MKPRAYRLLVPFPFRPFVLVFSLVSLLVSDVHFCSASPSRLRPQLPQCLILFERRNETPLMYLQSHRGHSSSSSGDASFLSLLAHSLPTLCGAQHATQRNDNSKTPCPTPNDSCFWAPHSKPRSAWKGTSSRTIHESFSTILMYVRQKSGTPYTLYFMSVFLFIYTPQKHEKSSVLGIGFKLAHIGVGWGLLLCLDAD